MTISPKERESKVRVVVDKDPVPSLSRSGDSLVTSTAL
jgi:hypothetical protein